uniref:Uncharacterized protein n=1 Tax=Anas zonorhyncha TaxID=75864 RepID=A0A8B9W1V8_9AVES
LVTWLLRCWDTGANSLELEGREAKRLGSLAKDAGIDKAIGNGATGFSLWRRLLSAVKERYPFKEELVCLPGKWTTMEKGIQYLRELAVREVIYRDLDNEQTSTDPDEVKYTRTLWQKFVQSAPSSYAISLAVMAWKDDEEPTVAELTKQLWQYEEMAKAPYCDWLGCSVHPWHRLPQERIFQGPKRVPVVVYFARSLRGPFGCGLAQG